MKRILLVLLLDLILFGICAASGQTISPVNTECGRKCSGQFTVSNDGISPMNVSVESWGFTVGADGKMQFNRLEDSHVHVTLSETSARIGPKAGHIFFFKAACDQTPCWFTFRTTMYVGHTAEGVAVALHLSDAVYLCPQARGCRESILKSWVKP
jgi:hypothetical protein